MNEVVSIEIYLQATISNQSMKLIIQYKIDKFALTLLKNVKI